MSGNLCIDSSSGTVKYFTAVFSESWSNTPAAAAERVQASSGLWGGGAVQRAGSTGPWRALPEPEGHISNQKPTGICKQYGEGLAPESSRELVGCQKLLMEADVRKQQSGLLVMESVGSRSLPKVIIDPESLPRSGLCWGKRSSWCHCCKSYPAPLLGTRQEPETGTLCQLFSMLSTGGMTFG